MRCILSENSLGISFDKNGVCNFCTDVNTTAKLPYLGDNSNTERLFKRIISAIRKRNKPKNAYDCLVLCSGGKDSVMLLWHAVKDFKLNPLVYTYDNGFIGQGIIDNLRRTTEHLGVDWLIFKPNDILKRAYYHFLRSPYRKKVSICVLCNLLKGGFFDSVKKILTGFNIPLLLDGRSKFKDFQGVDRQFDLAREFLDSNKSSFRIKNSDAEKAWHGRRFFSGIHLSPWRIFRQNPQKDISFLKRELGWRPPQQSWPVDSSNCRLTLLEGYLCHLYSIPDNPYEHEFSLQIRNGEISRDKALSNFNHLINIAQLKELLAEFDLNISNL